MASAPDSSAAMANDAHDVPAAASTDNTAVADAADHNVTDEDDDALAAPATAEAEAEEAVPADDDDDDGAVLAGAHGAHSADMINNLLAQAADSDDDGMAPDDDSYDGADFADPSAPNSLLNVPADDTKNDPGRHLQALADKTAQIAPGSELVDIVKALTPVSYRAGVLLLAYDRRTMTQHHVRVLQEAASLKTLNHAFQMVQSRGRVEITAHMPLVDEDTKAGLRRCTLEEREALAKQPIVETFSQIFGSDIIDARIRESK